MRQTRASKCFSVNTALLLLLSLFGSAFLIGWAAHTGRYPYVACVGLVPLFAAIRVCRPLGAFLSGAAWGLSLLAVSAAGFGPPVHLSTESFLLLAGVPAIYAWLGALLTRWIGFSPFVLGVGWMGVGLALSPLSFNAAIAGASLHDAGILQWITHALGYILVAFAVAYVNAGLVVVLGRLHLSVPYFVPRITSRDLSRLLSPQAIGCFSRLALQPSHARAPPLINIWLLNESNESGTCALLLEKETRRKIMFRMGNNYLAIGLLGVCVFVLTENAANAISVDGSYVAAQGGGGTLTVTITGASDPYDKIQVKCQQTDVPANFTVGGAAGWSAQAAPDFVVTKGTAPNETYHCVFTRSSSTTSNQTVTITHAAGKRGGGGPISVGLGADPKSVTTKTGENTLVAVGACDLPGTANCLCSISEDECVAQGGAFLGENSVCPGGGTCIPTVSEWGIAVLALLMLTAATIVVKKTTAAA